MSLYADDDPTKALAIQDTDDDPALHPPTDPQQLFNAALAAEPESAHQRDTLLLAAQRFEEHPERLPQLLPQFLGFISEGGDSLLRFWTLDMIHLAVGRGGLSGDVKQLVTLHCFPRLLQLLHTGSIPTLKAVIPILSTIYPVLFGILATSNTQASILQMFNDMKSTIIDFALNKSGQSGNVGVRAVAWKFVQKVILAATKPATSGDPRLQSRGSSVTDTNISHITQTGILSQAEIDQEGKKLQTELVTALYTQTEPAILHPIINSFPSLAKMRQSIAPLVVHSLASWKPNTMAAAGRPAIEIRAVEKTVRIAMTHLIRHPPIASHAAQLNDALLRQKKRMEDAFVEEATARKERRRGTKHPMEPPAGVDPESSEQAAKRARLEGSAGGVGSGVGKGPVVDISGMGVEEVVETVISGLRSVSSQTLVSALENARQALREGSLDAQPLLASPLGVGAAGEVKAEDEEIVNPLDIEDDDDDLLMMDDPELAIEEEEPTAFTDFVLPPPEPLDPSDKDYILSNTIERIWQSGADLASLPDPKETDAAKTAIQPKEMWMLLLARLATRGAEVKRKTISEFVLADFANRSKFASVWLNEEWYNERIGVSEPRQYLSNLEAIVSVYLPKVDPKDKYLATFIQNLPAIPPSLIDILADVCQDSERAVVGFTVLRDIVESRPPVREQALQTLLALCTHTDRKIRVMAIITTVRRWGQNSPMMPIITKYALSVLWRLVEAKPEVKNEAVKEEGGEAETEEQIGESAETDVEMKEEQPKEEGSIDRYLEQPSARTVQQHVELAFALAKRQQSLLDDIFKIYPQLIPEVQKAVEEQLMPLIQSLGATPKLMEILKKFPAGADQLVMRVIGVLSAEGAGQVLVSLVKSVLAERELDPKFVIPIVGELDKAEIEKQLPKIVSMLVDPETKDMVKTAFASMLQKMTPSDLMVALHQEGGAPLKEIIEAVKVCFSMTTVFRSDVLANAMNRIADLPTIPLIFVRTIIQVANTYKSLAPFIANHILPKLVAKKIWENGQLWDGFVMLAKRIAPASYGALLQLPKEQLREVVGKQPSMKAGLKNFLASKPGSKGALLEIFGDDE